METVVNFLFITKLRISAHSLSIETGRYARPTIPSNERFCKFCTGNTDTQNILTCMYSVKLGASSKCTPT
mgnify:CR=1 FL=1